MWRCLRVPTFSHFSRTPTCDRQTHRHTDTDTQTHDHGIYRESRARAVKRNKTISCKVLAIRGLMPNMLSVILCVNKYWLTSTSPRKQNHPAFIGSFAWRHETLIPLSQTVRNSWHSPQAWHFTDDPYLRTFDWKISLSFSKICVRLPWAKIKQCARMRKDFLGDLWDSTSYRPAGNLDVKMVVCVKVSLIITPYAAPYMGFASSGGASFLGVE